MKTLTLFFVSLLCFTLQAQEFNQAKFDSLVNRLEEFDRFNGSIAIMKEGKVVYTRGIGKRIQEESNQLNNPETIFRIGSISKSYTAVIILQMVQEGKLKLDDKLSTYFPCVPYSENITIANMLLHRSGIHSITDEEDYMDYFTKKMTREELVTKICSYKSNFDPDDRSEYSNSNFILLSFIAEEIDKKSFDQIFAARISKPLGLKYTYIGDKINPRENQARSYSYRGVWKLEDETDMSIPIGAGAVVSTPSDICKFYNALFSGKLLNAEMLETMTTINGEFGMGIFTFPFGERISYGHTGGIDGFSSMAGYFPAEKIAVALISNGRRINNNDIMIAALSAVFGVDFTIPTFSSYEVSAEDLEKYEGTYSAEGFPMKIDIYFEETQLFAQATGQSALPMDAESEHVFSFISAGIVLQFYPEKSSMVLKQGGFEVELFKE
jgi:CubicO group peptidase (beta-lactamase class C family)